MIIWIDGTYGIGKTQVALKVYEKLRDNKIELLNSDQYYREIIKEIAIFGGGTMPQNNKMFLKRFRKIIEEKISDSSKIIIIDMAITEMECKEILFNYINDKYNNIMHFILNATFDNIQNRIKLDFNRDREDALYYLDRNVKFLENNFKNAIWIDTNNKTAAEVADIIIKHIFREKKKDISF